MTEKDTREKLEADVHRVADETEAFYSGEGFIDTRKIIGWLDRQAAITERHWTEMYAASTNANMELKLQLDELHDRLDELKAEIATLECANDTLQYELRDRDRLERDSAYMPLPKGSDGEPIHVGCWMESTDHFRSVTTPKVARCIAVTDKDVLFKGDNGLADAPKQLIKVGRAAHWRRCVVDSQHEVIHKGDSVWGEDGRKWLVTGFAWGHTHPVEVEDENGKQRQLKPNWCSHNNPRTIEDVLRDYAIALTRDANPINVVRKNIERYAAELRELVKEQS